MPVSIVYAIWSGVGIAFATPVGWLWLGRRIDLRAMIELAFIAVRVVIVNVFSKSVLHRPRGQSSRAVKPLPLSASGIGKFPQPACRAAPRDATRRIRLG
jgi:hypothetical protein